MPAPREIDALLADAIQGRRATYPHDWDDATKAVLSRIFYNGVAGLLQENNGSTKGWPARIRQRIREEALSRTMWELGHGALLSELLKELSECGVTALLLKGTAVAYDVYSKPHLRERGDTDLLVEESSLPRVRDILSKQGFELIPEDDLPADLQAQETWALSGSNGVHAIDLHWNPFNAPALRGAMTFAELAEGARPQPRLCSSALVPDRAPLLFHTCLHRALHDCVPYTVAGEACFGRDRLIWLNDIALLGRALTRADWRAFVRTAVGRGFAATCLDGLLSAESCFGHIMPASVRQALERSDGRQDRYLSSNQLRRAAMDTAAIAGFRNKLRYALSRAVPAPAFMRSKYPKLANRSLANLYVRRFVELVRPRSNPTGG